MGKQTVKRDISVDWAKGVRSLPTRFRLSRIPIIGQFLFRDSFVGDPTTKAWLVPVGESIDLPDNVHLPLEIVRILIKKSSYRARMPVCVCREGFGCKNYPHTLGTMVLGSAFKDADQLGLIPLSVVEALAHAEKAVSMGLTPTIIWEPEGQTMLGGDRHKGLGICFCCNCCCDYRLGLRVGNEAFHKKVFRAEGVSLVVSDGCTLCGDCAKPEVCSASAISLGPAKSEIDLSRCVGCGACIRVCPEKAISFSIDARVDVVGKLLARVEEFTDVS